MTTPDYRPAGRWVFWFAMLVAATAILRWARGEIDQSHAALTLLLVVLGGSAGGGRILGFALAVSGFVLLDYFFQPPYDLLSVSKPLDWVVLVAFLASAFVATELLTRAREEAGTALKRSEEVASLSRVGSEMLRPARPEDALAALTALMSQTIGMSRVVVRLLETTGLHPVEADGNRDTISESEEQLAETVARSSSEHLGHAAALQTDGCMVRDRVEHLNGRVAYLAVALPLLAETRLVGVLLISGDGLPFLLDPAKRRFLSAICHYAALGAERVRLAAEAEHAKALREESRAKDEVLAAVSHDLRTPLTTIKLLAHTGVVHGDPTAAAIEEEADRLSQIVTNVLDLSRIRAGAVTLDLEFNTAEDLVGTAISRTSGLVKDRRIEPRLELGEPPLAGQFDFVQSLRIVGNLLDNALRYTPPGGVVEVQSAREGQWMVIRVSDSGPGVSAEDRERIFEPFFRSPSERPGGGHAGLGLSIARRLAELQGGTVDFESRRGGGSRFTLRLPAADLEVGAPPVEEQQTLESF